MNRSLIGGERIPDGSQLDVPGSFLLICTHGSSRLDVSNPSPVGPTPLFRLCQICWGMERAPDTRHSKNFTVFCSRVVNATFRMVIDVAHLRNESGEVHTARTRIGLSDIRTYDIPHLKEHNTRTSRQGSLNTFVKKPQVVPDRLPITLDSLDPRLGCSTMDSRGAGVLGRTMGHGELIASHKSEVHDRSHLSWY